MSGKNVNTAKRTSKKASLSKNQKNESNPLILLLISVLLGTLTLFASVLAFSLLLSKSADPDRLIPAACIASAVLSGAICGITAAKRSHKPIFALIAGGVMLIIVLVISLFFDSGEVGNELSFKTVLVLCLLLSAFISGTFAARKKKPAGRK